MGLRIQILISIGSSWYSISFFFTSVLVGKHHKNKSFLGKAAQRRTRGHFGNHERETGSNTSKHTKREMDLEEAERSCLTRFLCIRYLHTITQHNTRSYPLILDCHEHDLAHVTCVELSAKYDSNTVLPTKPPSGRSTGYARAIMITVTGYVCDDAAGFQPPPESTRWAAHRLADRMVLLCPTPRIPPLHAWPASMC